jgi:histidyl-tRNA synthetase
MHLFGHVVKIITEYFERAGFAQIQTPIFESVDLFKRSLGLHTDVVTKEMFLLQSRTDVGDEDQLCLRPELTASVVRAFIEHSIDKIPWNVFSVGPVFRYERPQKGRFRQFHQITIESIGTGCVGYDASLIGMLDHLFKQLLHIDQYSIQLNFLGCTQDRAEYKKLVYAFLQKHATEICATCTVRKDANTLRVFDCKSPTCQQLYVQAPVLTDHLCHACSQEWALVKQLLANMGIVFQHAPRLVRGLDYYNKTAFEFVSTKLGAQSAFCGGGRYDQLVQQLGAKNCQPAVGVGIGIERVMMLLEDQYVDNSIKAPLVVCIPQEQLYIPQIVAAGSMLLQKTGMRVELLLDGSLKSGMKKASKLNAAYVLFVGQQEEATGKVALKDMQTGSQELVSLQEIVEKFSRLKSV